MRRTITSTYSCNEIYFEPNVFPQAKAVGASLFGSRDATQVRMLQGIWPGSISHDQKLATVSRLSKDIRVLSDAERLGDLFALSLLHRTISVVVSSAKLYIDNSDIRPLYKYTTSLVLSAIPALFLVYVVGYPAEDLILNACISQIFAAAVSYFSLKASNFLRSLDLISYDNEFSTTKYLSRLLSSSAIDAFLTLCRHGEQLYMAPAKQYDFYNNYNKLFYCVKDTTSQPLSGLLNSSDIMSLIYLTTPLISITDKLIWSLGRVVIDGAILGLHSMGMIKDIRSPFIDAFSNINNMIPENEEKSPKHHYFTKEARKEYNKRKREAEERAQQEITKEEKQTKVAPKEILASPDTKQTESTNDYFRNRVKTKTRRSPTPAMPSDNQSTKKEDKIEFTTTYKVKIKDNIFYKINSSHLSENTWGVISLKKLKGDEGTFERSLASGHMSNKNSSIKFIKSSKEYEIRPHSVGDRILGKLFKGLVGFENLFPLGEAISVHDQFKASGGSLEPNLILFNKRVKHQDIGRGRA